MGFFKSIIFCLMQHSNYFFFQLGEMTQRIKTSDIKLKTIYQLLKLIYQLCV